MGRLPLRKIEVPPTPRPRTAGKPHRSASTSQHKSPCSQPRRDFGRSTTNESPRSLRKCSRLRLARHTLQSYRADQVNAAASSLTSPGIPCIGCAAADDLACAPFLKLPARRLAAGHPGFRTARHGYFPHVAVPPRKSLTELGLPARGSTVNPVPRICRALREAFRPVGDLSIQPALAETHTYARLPTDIKPSTWPMIT